MSIGNVLDELMFNPSVLHSSVAFTDNLNDGAGITIQVTVAGAKLGDFVLVSALADTEGLILYPYVSAANTVSVRVQNETGGNLTTDHTFYILVLPRRR